MIATGSVPSMQDIRTALALLFAPGDVFEVRGLEVQGRTNRTDCGWFNNYDAAAEAIAHLSGSALGVYVTMNPCLPELLGRACNRLKEWAPKDFATADRHILQRRWMLLDFDPIRLSGISSTDDEKALAKSAMRDTYVWLVGLGIPAASIIRADSGNGFHLLIRIDLPNDDAALALVDRCLAAVEEQVQSYPGIKMDRSNKNAARITKAYGSRAGKGDDAAAEIGRPHRDSGILTPPDSVVACPRDVLEKLAGFALVEKLATTLPSALPAVSASWIDGWLHQFAGQIQPYGPQEPTAYQGGRKWEFALCPFNPADDPHDENRSFVLIEAADGKLKATCQHNRCRRDNGWRSFRELIEPASERQRPSAPIITVTENEEPVAPPTSDQLALPADGRIGLAKDWADLYAGEYEAPWENWYFALLTHLGARVAKHLRLDDDLDTEALLYSILLGQSGAGKTVPIRKADADCAWADLGRDPHSINPEPGLFSVLHGAGSGEGIAEMLQAAHKRQMLLQVDEFSHITNKAKIDGGSLIQMLLYQFDRSIYDNVTKGGKSYALKSASLSLLSACVADVFPTLFDPKGGADTGIIPRFWIVTGPAGTEPKSNPRINRQKLDAIRERLKRILAAFAHLGIDQRVMVVPTPEAAALEKAWYDAEYFPLKSDPAMSRLNTYVKRFIMLGALVACGDQLLPGAPIPASVEVVQAALTMARWQYKVRQRYTPIISEKWAAKVEMTITRAFRDAGEQGMTRRNAQRVTNASRTGIEAWNRAFNTLCQNGNLVPLDALQATGLSHPGRPAGLHYKLVFML